MFAFVNPTSHIVVNSANAYSPAKSLKSVGSGCGHWPLVASGVAELVAVGGSEVVEDGGATGACRERMISTMNERANCRRRMLYHTVWVLHGDDLLVIVEVVQERSEDAPRGIQLVVAHKVGVVALEGVQDQGLIGLGDLEVREAAAVGQVQLGNHRLHGQTGQLGVHLDINRLVGLNTNDQLVAGDILEDTRGHILELDADLSLLLVEGWKRKIRING